MIPEFREGGRFFSVEAYGVIIGCGFRDGAFGHGVVLALSRVRRFTVDGEKIEFERKKELGLFVSIECSEPIHTMR